MDLYTSEGQKLARIRYFANSNSPYPHVGEVYEAWLVYFNDKLETACGSSLTTVPVYPRIITKQGKPVTGIKYNFRVEGNRFRHVGTVEGCHVAFNDELKTAAGSQLFGY